MPRLTDDTDFPLDAALTGAEKVVFTEGTSIKKATLDGIADFIVDGDGVYAPRVDALFISATDLWAREGTPSQGIINGGMTCWLLDANTSEQVSTTVSIPSHWQTIDIDFWAAKLDTASGNVVWRYGVRAVGAGDTPAASGVNSSAVAVPSTQYAISVTTPFTAIAVSPTKAVQFSAGRSGASGSDTYASDIALAAVVLRRAS